MAWEKKTAQTATFHTWFDRLALAVVDGSIICIPPTSIPLCTTYFRQAGRPSQQQRAFYFFITIARTVKFKKRKKKLKLVPTL